MYVTVYLYFALINNALSNKLFVLLTVMKEKFNYYGRRELRSGNNKKNHLSGVKVALEILISMCGRHLVYVTLNFVNTITTIN